MSYLIKPKGYKALLNLAQTEMGIKQIKDFFQQNLSSELRLRRVTAPLLVLSILYLPGNGLLPVSLQVFVCFAEMFVPEKSPVGRKRGGVGRL